MLWKLHVPIKLLHEKARIPEFKTNGAVGADLYYCGTSTCNIAPGGRAKLSTGIALAIPEGYVGLIRDKSGNASKLGLHVLAGVVDWDYRGEIQVCLLNTNHLPDCAVNIEPGDAIAQILFMPVIQARFNLTDDLSNTERGIGGFGSTGGGING
jgi:dUTP pyrophosphatase